MVQLATRIHEETCGVSAVGGNREFAIRSHGHNAAVGRRTALDGIALGLGDTRDHYSEEYNRGDHNH